MEPHRAIIEFLSSIHRLGVQLWVDGDRLGYSAPDETLTPQLRRDLAAREAEVVAFLRRLSDPNAGEPPLRDSARLSFAQQRLWLLDQFAPGLATYNIPTAVQLAGRLDLAALERSLSQIIGRHEALRTTFSVEGGRPVQQIAPPWRISLKVIDLGALPEARRADEARRLAGGEAQRPFDLARGPLLRTALLRLEKKAHVLLLTLHHIVADGWSLGVLVRELGIFYAAFGAGGSGEAASLPELPIQYADYAEWQREWLQGELLQEHLGYWTERLAGAPAVLELPADRPRPQLQTFSGAIYRFALDSALSAAINALSRREGVTLFMTLLAAFQTLLYRHSGQEDVLVGSPIANRMRVETENLIGLFVNMLALRSDLSGNPRFLALLKQVRAVCLEAYAHQDLPFEQLVEAIQPARDPSRPPLVQVVFSLQNAPRPALDLAGLTLRMLDVDSGTAKFDLTLNLEEDRASLCGWFEYNTDLFDAATIARMAGHLQTLLQGVVADPQRRIADAPILTPAERNQVLGDWNNSAADYPRDGCLHQVFEAQADLHPDRVALAYADQALSYAVLNARANQLAHHLLAHGVAPDTLVALCAERSLEMLIGILGILKAGGAYVPLDPAYPPERLAFMLDDTQAPILVTATMSDIHAALGGMIGDRSASAHTRRIKPAIVDLYADWPNISARPGSNPPRTVRSDQRSYIIYTSGSTGRPKGVMALQRSALNLVYGLRAFFDDPQIQNAALITSISFDISVNQIFPTLLFGRTLHIIPDAVKFDSAALMRYARANAIQLLDCVPSYLHMTLTNLAPARLPNALRYLLIGGEKLETQLLQKIFAQLGEQVAVVNIYGLTEISDINAFAVIGAADLERPATIGRPLQNNQVYVLNPRRRLQPIGVLGEVCIAGESLTRGYLKRPDLTAEKFLPDPFGAGGRMCATGDIGRWRSDGAIELLGRLDHQVKLRGYRIELGEIEAALARHASVRECAVAARQDAPGDSRLVAYVVPQGEPGPASAELRSALRTQLPDYMLPSVFVLLDALPKTPNGKLDRAKLPAPDIPRPDLQPSFVAPRTPAEIALAAIWSQALGLEQIGIHDNFFELGGDSILSLQVVSKARQADLHFTPQQVLQHQTIAELAARSIQPRAAHAEQGVVTGPAPLTIGAHRAFEADFHARHHWNGALVFELPEPPDPILLQQTVGTLLERHDALRLRFVQESSGWRSFLSELETTVPFSHIQMPASEFARSGRFERVAADLQASLNLSSGPLLRVALFNCGPQHPSRLLIIAHNLVVDGISWRILLEDLQSIYQQLRQSTRLRLAPKTTSFKYWAERLQEYAHSSQLRSELSYWLARPGRLNAAPLDYALGPNIGASTQVVRIALSKADTHLLLHKVPEVYGAQIGSVLATALAQVYRQWVGAGPALIDMTSHGREELFAEVDLSRTIGYFTNVFPVVLDLEDGWEAAQALQAIKDQLSRVPNRGVGYGLLRYMSGDEEIVGALRGQQQADVRFNYQGQADRVLAGPWRLEPLRGAPIGPTANPHNPRRYLLEVFGIIDDGQLGLSWRYSEHLHRRSTIERLAQSYLVWLQTLLRDLRS